MSGALITLQMSYVAYSTGNLMIISYNFLIVKVRW